MVPELFGKEKNMTYYHELMSELEEIEPDLRAVGHTVVRRAGMSETVRAIRDRLCEYFAVDATTAKLGVKFRKIDCAGKFDW